MLEQLLLFAPGFVLGLFMSAVLAALGVILRLRDEALSAFSHAQVAVLGAMLAVIAGWPLLIGAWGLAMLVAVAGLWLIKPVAAVASSRHLLVLLLAWSACLLLADNHAQARLLSASAVEGQLLLVQWRDVVAHGVVGALGAAVLGGVSKALLAHQLLPWLPGAATASECMALLERGHRLLKFFPAEAAGGVAMLKSLAGPLPQLGFCATGGIGPGNARDYLALGSVRAVGGSWLTPADAVAAQDWSRVTALSAQAAALRGG